MYLSIYVPMYVFIFFFCTSAQVTNRSDEKNYLKDMETTMATGTAWEKVTKYCDLKPKTNAKGVAAAKNERYVALGT